LKSYCKCYERERRKMIQTNKTFKVFQDLEKISLTRIAELALVHLTVSAVTSRLLGFFFFYMFHKKKEKNLN
jgi:hypothetical protein